MIDDKSAKVRALLEKRDQIDAELAAIFSASEQAKRGRPRKDAAADDRRNGEREMVGSSAVNGATEQ